MTTSQRITALALATTASITSAFGFAEFARGPILLRTNLSETYNTYTLGSTDTSGDYITTLAPTLTYGRSAGRGKIDASIGASFSRYAKQRTHDSDDYNANTSITLPVAEGSRLDGGATLAFADSTQLDYFTDDLVNSKSVNASFNLNYKLGVKHTLGESFTYGDSWRSLYSDQQTFHNDFTYSYNDFLYGTTFHASHGYSRTTSSGDNFLSAAIDQDNHSISTGLSRPLYGEVVGTLTVGYNFMNRSAAETSFGQTNNSSSFYSLGLNGPFLPQKYFPKLKSNFSLSYQQSNTAGINDNGSKFLSGSLGLSWEARERTSVTFNANRNMQLSVTDLSVETTDVNLGVTERLGYSTNLSGSIGYSWNTYRGIKRTDNRITGRLSANRSLNKNWSVSANYTYTQNQNDSSGLQPGPFQGRDYTNHSVTLSISNIF